MILVYCEKCGGYTPEGFKLCPPCMREAGAGEYEISAAAELMDIANIINMRDTDASRTAAVESILNIKSRLEGNAVAENEKEKAEAQIQPE